MPSSFPESIPLLMLSHLIIAAGAGAGADGPPGWASPSGLVMLSHLIIGAGAGADGPPGWAGPSGLAGLPAGRVRRGRRVRRGGQVRRDGPASRGRRFSR
ncbi:hypothetical protein AB0B63_19175 [Micromonospora sp. NPDC049081]|uniref:hypothetical protein n=1 Tax=Micromonospora sp. NPDC049081 TaxID=3155150 RepID=UPI0033E4186E